METKHIRRTKWSLNWDRIKDPEKREAAKADPIRYVEENSYGGQMWSYSASFVYRSPDPCAVEWINAETEEVEDILEGTVPGDLVFQMFNRDREAIVVGANGETLAVYLTDNSRDLPRGLYPPYCIGHEYVDSALCAKKKTA